MTTAVESKPMRQRMPLATAFIDRLRDAFGADLIDQAMREGGLFASEAGHIIGTPRKVSAEFIYGP
jgi:hypothetical protein